MAQSPAFQIYPNDLLAGYAATFSLEEFGAFSLLLMFEWSLTGLPVEPEKLAKLCRVSMRKFRGVWSKVGEEFVERDGRLYHPMLDNERQKQQLWREKSREGGRRSAEVRAKGGARVVEPPYVPPYQPTPQPNANTSSSSSTSSTTTPSPSVIDEFAIASRLSSDADRTALSTVLERVPDRSAFLAELAASLDSMPGHAHVTPIQAGQALRDFRGIGALRNPTLKLFRGFLRNATERLPQTTPARSSGPRSPAGGARNDAAIERWLEREEAQTQPALTGGTDGK